MIAASLRAEMARHRVSGRALADALGHNPQWVQHRTSGRVPLTSDDIRPIASALGVTPNELADRLFADLPPLATTSATDDASAH